MAGMKRKNLPAPDMGGGCAAKQVKAEVDPKMEESMAITPATNPTSLATPVVTVTIDPWETGEDEEESEQDFDDF